MTDVLSRLRAALASRYTIERELGSGGMATVYLAEEDRVRIYRVTLYINQLEGPVDVRLLTSKPGEPVNSQRQVLTVPG
jgi:hypothetical protein